MDLWQERRPLNLAASCVLDARAYHLVSATIYCFIRGNSTDKSSSSLLWLSLWNDCHVKPATFYSLGRATFNAGKEQGEHLLAERQEQGMLVYTTEKSHAEKDGLQGTAELTMN